MYYLPPLTEFVAEGIEIKCLDSPCGVFFYISMRFKGFKSLSKHFYCLTILNFTLFTTTFTSSQSSDSLTFLAPYHTVFAHIYEICSWSLNNYYSFKISTQFTSPTILLVDDVAPAWRSSWKVFHSLRSEIGHTLCSGSALSISVSSSD